MTQKLVAEAFPFMGAFDDPWDIRYYTGAVVPEAHDAQLRHKGRKWIGGDFRTCRRDACEEGRFAGIGQAHQPDIGQ